MLRIHFVRHGQTEASRDNRFCGTTDLPLTDAGLEMAGYIAARCAEKGGFKAIYASPMRRTVQTAQPTSDRLGLPIQTDPGLREIAYGSWENRLEKEVEETESAAFHAWAENPGLVPPPGGETGRDIAARATPVIDAIRARFTDGEVLVVSHKATIRVLTCSLLGLDVNLFRARVDQPTGAFTSFAFKKSGPLLLALGDVCHLPPALRGVGT
jgi:probable phosphoglycerate mutase